MRTQHTRPFSRRRFLSGLTLAGAGGFLGFGPRLVAAEPPPETTTLKLGQSGALCFGVPQAIAEALLHAEGFSNVHYVQGLQGTAQNKALATGEIHFGMTFAGQHLVQIDAGDPILLVAGLHVGCYELFGTDRVHTIRDLRGKTVAVTALGTGRHIFLASMLAHVGMDIRKDVTLVTYPSRKSSGRSRSGMWWSTPPSIAPGCSTSVAWSLAIATSSAPTPSLRNGRSGRS